MIWLLLISAVVVLAVVLIEKRKYPAPKNESVTEARNMQGVETESMIYFADNPHGMQDKEYRFRYKFVGGSWRAYILKMPSLNGRDPQSIPTHRLWDESGNPYICWQGSVSSKKDIQNISRIWANSLQEYIATGKRFGAEQDL